MDHNMIPDELSLKHSVCQELKQWLRQWPVWLLAMLAVSAYGQTTISTVSGWNGTTSAQSFGQPQGIAADTYGETFVVPAGEPVISDINFRLGYNFGQGISFTGYLMAWDGTEATGSVLFQSTPASVDSSTAGFAVFDFPIPNVVLTAGNSYVFFLLATAGSGGPATAQMAVTGTPSTYTSGNFVYTNSGGSFANLTTPWTQASSGAYGSAVFSATFNPPPQTPATLTSPTPATVLPGASATFAWSPATGSNIDGYWLFIGTTGVGSKNLYDSGETTATSITYSALPLTGATIYVRLYTSFGGTLVHNDYTYTAAKQAILTAPAPGTLPGPSATFTWSAATGSGVDGYWLFLGTTGVGSKNLYDSGETTATSETVGNLPLTGATIYARVYTSYNGTLKYLDSTYTAAKQAVLTMPAPTTTLPGPSTTFTWSAATGSNIQGYWLFLGTTGAGSKNLYDSGEITATSATVNNLPLTGATIYARVYTSYNGTLVYSDYTYTAAKGAVLTTPAPGSTLGGSMITFDWSPATGSNVQGYWLFLGTTGPGSKNLYDSGETTALTKTVSNLPTTGGTIYARVYTSYNGTLTYNDYTYTAK